MTAAAAAFHKGRPNDTHCVLKFSKRRQHLASRKLISKQNWQAVINRVARRWQWQLVFGPDSYRPTILVDWLQLIKTAVRCYVSHAQRIAVFAVHPTSITETNCRRSLLTDNRSSWRKPKHVTQPARQCCWLTQCATERTTARADQTTTRQRLKDVEM